MHCLSNNESDVKNLSLKASEKIDNAQQRLSWTSTTRRKYQVINLVKDEDCGTVPWSLGCPNELVATELNNQMLTPVKHSTVQDSTNDQQLGENHHKTVNCDNQQLVGQDDR
jgi:hypothetical protein